uniref:Atypical chemokine receptor 1 n=1 Tax=Cricetulus griseus TaxID=10029 RepID=A0A8C2MSF0_CRIGR
MGNCLHPVETSFSLDENGSQFSSEFWIYSYEDNATYEVMDNFSIGAAAPCYSCNLLDSSSLPFFILTSVLGVLASGTVLFAILKPLSHWQICPSWPILAQLAVGSGLFSFAVPVLAPGLNTAHSTGLCFLGYWIWYTFEVHTFCNLFYHLHCVTTGSFGSQGGEEGIEQGARPLG